MLMRLSQKLATKIKTKISESLPPDTNPFADWSASVFSANRVQYVLLTNSASLYTVVMPGHGVTSGQALVERGLARLHEFMAEDGLEFLYLRLIAPAAASVVFSKALNRSVTGSMNDLIFHAKVRLTEGGLSPHKTSFHLNDIPFSSLGYSKPREVFKSLLPAVSEGS